MLLGIESKMEEENYDLGIKENIIGLMAYFYIGHVC